MKRVRLKQEPEEDEEIHSAAQDEPESSSTDVTVANAELGDPNWLIAASNLPGFSEDRARKQRKELAVRAVAAGLARSSAAELVGVSMTTLAKWAAKDPAFNGRLITAAGIAKARAASKLQLLIAQGDVSAIMFFLRTRTNEFRERQEILHDDSEIARDEKYL